MLKQWQVCGVLLLIGSQASAAAEKIAFLGFSHRGCFVCDVCCRWHGWMWMEGKGQFNPCSQGLRSGEQVLSQSPDSL